MASAFKTSSAIADASCEAVSRDAAPGEQLGLFVCANRAGTRDHVRARDQRVRRVAETEDEQISRGYLGNVRRTTGLASIRL